MPEGPALVRSIAAVGAGFFAIQMLGLGADEVFRAAAPEAFDAQGHALGNALSVELLYTALLEAVGGYITARFAARQPVRHALILAAVVLALNLVITLLAWGSAPAWYALAALALVVPMCFAGGKLGELHMSRRAP